MVFSESITQILRIQKGMRDVIEGVRIEVFETGEIKSLSYSAATETTLVKGAKRVLNK